MKCNHCIFFGIKHESYVGWPRYSYWCKYKVFKDPSEHAMFLSWWTRLRKTIWGCKYFKKDTPLTNEEWRKMLRAQLED